MQRNVQMVSLAGIGCALLVALAAGAAPKPASKPTAKPITKPTPKPATPGAKRENAAAAEFFESKVRPVLVERCQMCHGAAKQQGSLRLDSLAATLKGGDRGPALKAGDPENSLLVRAIAGHEAGLKMPPTTPLKPEQIEAITAWVKAGAVWPAVEAVDTSPLWSTQPIRRVSPPTFSDPRQKAWVKNSVDAFILKGLAAKGMVPAPPAGQRELMRRAYFDLTGLPPTPEEVGTYLADKSPNAYERLVDRLLASPRYGERWARYWLDLVRYADSNGYERDAEKPQSWKYRDYVIRALNTDKPYNQFVTEQLAGDELPGRNEETVTATGFLRLGTWDDEPNDPVEYKYERLDDLVHATGTAFLGLTVKCARCHDHKFDPIPQRDYYAFAAAFWGGYVAPGDGKLLGGPPSERLGYPVLGFTDMGPQAPPLHLLEKGDARREGPEVPPGFPSLVPALLRPVAPPPPGAATTHRRLQLAEWVADPRNPLTARVQVNRLWQHHFGQGLVRTPNNFGRKGDPPTHPELLDWLASEFMAGGWRMKRMHRLLMLSNSYRMASTHPQETAYAQQDFANTRWWRFNRQRLDADALRDAMLAVDGSLNLEEGGRGFTPTVSREALEGLSRKGAEWQPSTPDQQRRRTIYMFLKRSLIMPLLTAFDFADTTQPLEARDVTTVAPQALALMNNQFVLERATTLARRVEQEAGADPLRRIDRAWRLALGRPPSVRERDVALAHLQQVATAPAPAAVEATEPDKLPGLKAWLRADRGLTVDGEFRVGMWADPGRRLAALAGGSGRPTLVPKGLNGRDVLRFDGKTTHLTFARLTLPSQQYTILAVATDQATSKDGMPPGHRELFSNWNGGAGNSVTSLFLGLTGASTVRFSDAFNATANLGKPGTPFLLAATSAADGVSLFQGQNEIGRVAAPLPERNLTPPFILGRQGAMDGEYWQGDLAELVIFDRALSDAERKAVSEALLRRYGMAAPPETPSQRAMASLCHILLNTNEFAYVD